MHNAEDYKQGVRHDSIGFPQKHYACPFGSRD